MILPLQITFRHMDASPALEVRIRQLAYVALRDAFLAARRKLQDYERRRRLEVKSHIGPAEGWVCELDAGHGWGRIETDDGRLLYFHRNSVLRARFKDLATGTRVRFAEESGDRGPQASTVHVIS